MRIGIDARFYGGEQSKGLGRYTQKLIEYLAATDRHNEYVVFLQPDSFAQWSITAKNFTPVSAPYRWYTLAEQLFMPWLIWRAQVDLMHFPHFNVPLLYRGTFVVTIHDLIILRFPTSRATTLGPLLYKLKHWAGQLVMRHAALQSAHILTVSEFSKTDIAQYYSLPPSKITVTYEAADPPRTQPSLSDQAQTLQQYHIKPPYLLYIGNAYPHKNLELLIGAMKALKQQPTAAGPWQLVLVGREDYFYKRLHQLAWSENVDDVVVFPGFVPDRQLAALSNQAALYVFPSLYEGFGLPALEAMVHGTPVLAARSSCLPEILGDGAAYFNPASVSDMIKQIQALTESATRTALIAAGQRRVQQYAWQHTASATARVYEQVTATTDPTTS